MSLILKAPFVRNWKDDEERIVQIGAAPAGAADTYPIMQGYFPSYDAILSQKGMKMFTLEVKIDYMAPGTGNLFSKFSTLATDRRSSLTQRGRFRGVDLLSSELDFIHLDRA